jgi:hypothetical protein
MRPAKEESGPSGGSVQSSGMYVHNFCTEWFFQAPIDQVWEQIADMASYPAKWPVWKRVEFREAGPGLRPGSVIDHVARGPLPFTARFSFEITALEPPRLMEYVSSGDLVGKCTWALDSRDGGTMVVSCWEMGTSIGIFNLLPMFPFVKAIMGKHHDYVMEQGYRGFRDRLEGGRQV